MSMTFGVCIHVYQHWIQLDTTDLFWTVISSLYWQGWFLCFCVWYIYSNVIYLFVYKQLRPNKRIGARMSMRHRYFNDLPTAVYEAKNSKFQLLNLNFKDNFINYILILHRLGCGKKYPWQESLWGEIWGYSPIFLPIISYNWSDGDFNLPLYS